MDNIKEVFLSWFSGAGSHFLDNTIRAVLTLVVGILLIKAVLRLLKRALEKTRLEKAAYGLILSLTKIGLYLLLGLSLAAGLGVNICDLYKSSITNSGN